VYARAAFSGSKREGGPAAAETPRCSATRSAAVGCVPGCVLWSSQTPRRGLPSNPCRTAPSSSPPGRAPSGASGGVRAGR
jgi:hypothetical protein